MCSQGGPNFQGLADRATSRARGPFGEIGSDILSAEEVPVVYDS